VVVEVVEEAMVGMEATLEVEEVVVEEEEEVGEVGANQQ
jgi:hypothetical protein